MEYARRILLKDVQLGNLMIPKDTMLDTHRGSDGTYTIFHHTGWWANIDKEHFEVNVFSYLEPVGS